MRVVRFGQMSEFVGQVDVGGVIDAGVVHITQGLFVVGEEDAFKAGHIQVDFFAGEKVSYKLDGYFFSACVTFKQTPYLLARQLARFV